MGLSWSPAVEVQPETFCPGTEYGHTRSLQKPAPRDESSVCDINRPWTCCVPAGHQGVIWERGTACRQMKRVSCLLPASAKCAFVPPCRFSQKSYVFNNHCFIFLNVRRKCKQNPRLTAKLQPLVYWLRNQLRRMLNLLVLMQTSTSAHVNFNTRGLVLRLELSTCLCAFLDFIQCAQHSAGSCLQKDVAVSELQSEAWPIALKPLSAHVGW